MKKAVFSFQLRGCSAASLCHLKAPHSERKARKGFTLIESLIAIAIITISIAGPLWAAGQSMRAAEIAQDQLVASSLAQEGVEYVRAVRDNEYLAAYKADITTGNTSADAWNHFLQDVQYCTTAKGGCEMNLGDWDNPYPSSTGQPLLPCSQGGASCASPLKLRMSGTEGIYNRTQGSATLFTRVITVDSVGTTQVPVEQVIAMVSWTTHGTTYHVSTTDDLTPWQ